MAQPVTGGMRLHSFKGTCLRLVSHRLLTSLLASLVKSHVFVCPTHHKPTDTQPLGSGAYAVPRSLVNEELTVARVQVVAGAKDQRDGRTIAIKRISDVFLKDPVPAKRYSPRSSC